MDLSFVQIINRVEWVVVELFPRDTDKTANVNHRHINNNKTANTKDKTKKSLQRRVRSTIRISHNKNCKNKLYAGGRHNMAPPL